LLASINGKAVKARRFAQPTCAYLGGGLFTPSVLENIRKNVDLHTVYGSTKAEPISSIRRADVGAQDRQKIVEGKGLPVGKVVPQIECKIGDAESKIRDVATKFGTKRATQDILTKSESYGSWGELARPSTMQKVRFIPFARSVPWTRILAFVVQLFREMARVSPSLKKAWWISAKFLKH